MGSTSSPFLPPTVARNLKVVVLAAFAVAMAFVTAQVFRDSRFGRQRAAAHMQSLRTEYQFHHEEATLQQIIDYVDHGTSFERTYGCGVLQELGPDAQPALPALMRALNCGDPFVEREAALAFGTMGKAASPAIPLLEAKVAEDIRRDSSLFAAESLAEIGSVESLEVLEEAFERSKSNASSSSDGYERALKKLKSRGALSNCSE